MSDYPNIDALIQGREDDKSLVWKLGGAPEWPTLRHEVAAMLEQIEALKEERSKWMAVEFLVKKTQYPNIDALVQGRVSGSPNEWPQLHCEVAEMRKQLEVQREWLAKRTIAAQEQITQIFNLGHQNANLFDKIEEKDKEIQRLQEALNSAESLNELKEAEIKQLQADIRELFAGKQVQTYMSPQERCRQNNVKNCHFCDSVDCCDNASPLKKQVQVFQERIKQLYYQRDCLHKHFGMSLYQEMPTELIKILDKIDGEKKGEINALSE